MATPGEVANFIRDIRVQSTAELSRALLLAGLLVEGKVKELCPVDTGTLQKSYNTQRINEFAVSVGTNIEYAPFVEFGTLRRNNLDAQPHLEPGLQATQERAFDLIEAAVARSIR